MITLFVQGNMEHSLQVVDLWKAFISDIHNSKEKESDPKTLDDKIRYRIFMLLIKALLQAIYKGSPKNFTF